MKFTHSSSRTSSEVRRASTAPESLSYAVADGVMGKVLIARSARGVCAILLGEDAEVLTLDLAKRFPKAALALREDAVKDDLARVVRYIETPSIGLELELDVRGTRFQRRVWEALRAVRIGRTVTYTELGEQMTPPSHPRAVASACAANPIAMAIPCHRVVRNDGELAGYRWGIERKRELLTREATA